MKNIRTYSNIFEKDKKYKSFKDDFEKNPHDEHFVRQSKEAYKCVLSCDLKHLLNNVSPNPNISSIPPFVINLLSGSKYASSVKTINCIMSYFNDPSSWNEYCSVSRVYSGKIKNNVNHKFGSYFKTIYNDARKELNTYRRPFNAVQINEYRFTLIFFKIVIRTFYFSSLPASIIPYVYEKCTEENPAFSSYYTFDEAENLYKRIKFKKNGASLFNETIAWWLVYNNILHFGLNK